MGIRLLADAHCGRQTSIAHSLRIRNVVAAALVDEVVECLRRDTSHTRLFVRAVFFQPLKIFFELRVLLLLNAVLALDRGRMLTVALHQRLTRQTVDALCVCRMVALVKYHLWAAIRELRSGFIACGFLLLLFLAQLLAETVDAASPFVVVALRREVLIFHSNLY